MTVEEFLKNRKPLFIDPETSLIVFPTSKHMDTTCAVWFHDTRMPFSHTVRGYYWKDEKDEFIMLYWNDFETPNIVLTLLVYIFEYFPTLKWIGLGCHKGKPGEIWKPKLKITRE